MKSILKIVSVAVFAVLVSCSETVSEINPENIATVDFKIDGMVCAMGCAKTIQDAIGQTEGVTESKVDFATGIAHFEFDKAFLTEEEIVSKIEEMAEGQYKVGEVVESEEESEEESEVTAESFGVEIPTFEIPNLFTYVVKTL